MKPSKCLLTRHGMTLISLGKRYEVLSCREKDAVNIDCLHNSLSQVTNNDWPKYSQLNDRPSLDLIGSVASSRKLVILFVIIAEAVIVLWLGGIVSVVCSIVIAKGCKPFM